MKFYKKGAIEKSVWMIVTILLGALIVVVSFAYLVPLGSVLIPKKITAVTDANFKALTNMIQEMVDDSADIVNERNFLFQLENDYVLVGFNKGTQGAWTTCTNYREGGVTKTELKKPINLCGDYTCLCIYKRSLKEYPIEETPLGDCAVYPEVDTFYSLLKDDAPEKVKLNFRGYQLENFQEISLVIFGKCVPPTIELLFGGPPPREELGITNLHLKKDGKQFLIYHG